MNRKKFTGESYPTPAMKELFEAVLTLNSPPLAANFFRDLLTLPELTEFANRWQMVKLLVAGKSYEEISKELKTSTATVTRVAHWLREGAGGYETVAKLMFQVKAKPTRRRRHLQGKYTSMPDNPYYS